MPQSNAGSDAALLGPAIMVIGDWLVAAVAHRLGLLPSAIDRTRLLALYGLDVLAMLELVTALEERLGCSLPHTCVWDTLTIATMAQSIAQTLIESEKALHADMRAWIDNTEGARGPDGSQ